MRSCTDSMSRAVLVVSSGVSEREGAQKDIAEGLGVKCTTCHWIVVCLCVEQVPDVPGAPLTPRHLDPVQCKSNKHTWTIRKKQRTDYTHDTSDEAG